METGEKMGYIRDKGFEIWTFGVLNRDKNRDICEMTNDI